MVNIIFETSFSNKKNINFIIDNDKITWKTLFYFISKKIKIHPYFIYLQIGEKNFNGDNINYLKPFHYLKFNQFSFNKRCTYFAKVTNEFENCIFKQDCDISVLYTVKLRS